MCSKIFIFLVNVQKKQPKTGSEQCIGQCLLWNSVLAPTMPHHYSASTATVFNVNLSYIPNGSALASRAYEKERMFAACEHPIEPLAFSVEVPASGPGKRSSVPTHWYSSESATVAVFYYYFIRLLTTWFFKCEDILNIYEVFFIKKSNFYKNVTHF